MARWPPGRILVSPRLADFAALYGAEVQELIHPPSSSLEQVTEELNDAESRRVAFRHQAQISASRVRQAQAELADAEFQLYSAERELAALDERVDFLQQEKQKFSLKPDPSAVSTAAEFIEALRQFRTRAGNPPYRTIALRAGSEWSPRTMDRNLRSHTDLPSLKMVTIMITGCGGSEEDLAAFTAAWERIRSTAG
jgi:hypothetical protein